MQHLILLADNECETPGVLYHALTPLGFVVCWVNAHSFLVERSLKISNYSGIILNLDMRSNLGMTALDKLREHSVDIPVLAITAESDHGRLEEAVQKGVRDYMLKPVDSHLLREKCLRHFSTR